MLNETNIPLEEDGIEEEILVDEEVAITKAMWGDIGGNIANQTDLQNALDAKQDSLTEAQLNAVNSGITAEKVTTYDGYADQIASKADQSALNAEATTREQADTALGRRIDDEATARQQADNGLQTQIDAITSKSDVVDVVANYAALQAYDTSSLGNNDVIKVLDDETHEDALTYYRWSTATQTWTYIGQEAPYYSKGQMNVMLQGKQDKLTAGANIKIENGTISATDTTYTAGNGLNLEGTEFSADMDVLATKEDLEDYYTKPETDNLLAPKLEAEVVAELPTAGEEGKLYLTPKAHTTQTATGNPITATVAEDAGKIESFQLDGDTYQQSYEGKNLLEITKSGWETKRGITVTWENSSFVLNGAATADVDFYGHGTSWSDTTKYSPLSAGTYTVSIRKADMSLGANLELKMYNRLSDGQQRVFDFGASSSGYKTFSLDEDEGYTIFYLSIKTGQSFNNERFYVQLELSSTATDFEPFVGGQPSPNPDYPQPIQTVTGLQTISINGTDYPLELGNIKLCKIEGQNQPLVFDYIYKDGENWKIRKTIAKQTIIGSEVRLESRYANVQFATVPKPLDSRLYGNYTAIFAYNDHSIYRYNSGGWNNSDLDHGFFTTPNQERYWFGYPKGTSLEAMQQELDGAVTYYALATPTDTAITDQTLISQLEAIRTASLQNGANTITNTATGSNLAGDMEIGYYSYNPTNRYDKWLWLDLNNNYEQIGS